MSLFVRQRRSLASGGPEIPARDAGTGRGAVSPAAITDDTALRHSAVWACRRLRANLISTMPVDVFRRVDGYQVEMPKPPVLVEPGGQRWRWIPWAHASQWELDGSGNSIGLITEVNALGLPARIDLYPSSVCSVRKPKGSTEYKYKIDGTEYTPDKVWHEVQYPVSGLPVGLSPIAYAAWSISEGLSMQQFALDWFGNGGIPKARLRNTQKKLDVKEARIIKNRHKASIQHGDLFVHGVDWEYDLMQAEQAGVEFIEGRRINVPDIARYFDCPVDLIEAAVSAPGSLRYETTVTRNLQFLIMALGPAIIRREDAWSAGLLPRPRYVKLNTDALLRMDPQTQARVIDMRIRNRTLTVTRARELYNEKPLTPGEIAEFETLFGPPRSQPAVPPPQTPARGAEPVNPLSAVPYDNSAAWAATYGEGPL
ncbi:phage portal protein [Micromonospora aurantiaca]|uniref:phage portal protein n=1 Tax=Micromonospora aurantiaca (nom. illeg.) TaxID=47850 RepID=UPI0034121913